MNLLLKHKFFIAFFLLMLLLLLLLITSCNGKEKVDKKSHLKQILSLKTDRGNRKNSTKLNKRGHKFYKNKKFKKAKKLWIKAIKSDPSYYLPYFNLACVLALQKKKNDAILLLKRALKVEHPFKLINFIKNDKDLISIRGNKKYKDLLSKLPKTKMKFLNGEYTAIVGPKTKKKILQMVNDKSYFFECADLKGAVG